MRCKKDIKTKTDPLPAINVGAKSAENSWVKLAKNSCGEVC